MFVRLGSLGVLLYTLLSGETPFAVDRNDSHEVILARTNSKLQFTGPKWQRVTDDAKVKSSFFSIHSDIDFVLSSGIGQRHVGYRSEETADSLGNL